MKINNITNMHCMSFAILKALFPSLDSNDICGVREACPKPSLIHSENPNNSRFTSMIVRLRSPQLVSMIMSARKSFKNNYFSTNNIDLGLLNSELASALPNSRVFVNEVLSTPDRLSYISIKETAKKLGFKYV